jgi:hypothetical protein
MYADQQSGIFGCLSCGPALCPFGFTNERKKAAEGVGLCQIRLGRLAYACAILARPVGTA